MARPGPDHERRVGDHQVEPPTGHRLDQVAGEQFPAQPVQGGRGRGEAQRTGVHVGGGHGAGVPGQVQGLHAAAGAEIQRGRDRRPDRGLRQRDRGAADAEHVVGPQRPGAHVVAEIGEHPPAAGVVGVRAQIEPGADPVPGADQQPGGVRLVRCQRRERGPSGRLGGVTARHEQPDQGGERIVAGRRVPHGVQVAAGERRAGGRSEQAVHALRGVVGGAECGAQPQDAGVVEKRCGHVAHPAEPTGPARPPPCRQPSCTAAGLHRSRCRLRRLTLSRTDGTETGT